MADLTFLDGVGWCTYPWLHNGRGLRSSAALRRA